MPRLQRRFRWFNRALHFYPKAYYRQYGTQTLQTLADLLDEPNLRRQTRLRILVIAWLELLRSIPKQRMIASLRRWKLQPGRWLRRYALICLILLVPLLWSLVISHFFRYSTTPFDSFLSNPTVITIWFYILPIFATLLALYALIRWLIARRAGGSFRSRLSLIWPVGLLVIGVGGAWFLLYFGHFNYQYRQQLQHGVAESERYQRLHPTLACQLLPAATAQSIMKPVTVRLDNSHDSFRNDYSGIVSQNSQVQVSRCGYYPKNYMDYGLQVTVHQALTPTAEAGLQQQFNSQPYSDAQTITLDTYHGYYLGDLYSFNLSLWVDNYWLEISAHDFYHADKAMRTAIDNLHTYVARQAAAQAEATQHNIPAVPLSQDQLSDADRSQISQLLVDRDLQPAGVTYTVNYDTIAGRRISGSITYSNGTAATYSADKQGATWLIVSYQRR